MACVPRACIRFMLPLQGAGLQASILEQMKKRQDEAKRRADAAARAAQARSRRGGDGEGSGDEAPGRTGHGLASQKGPADGGKPGARPASARDSDSDDEGAAARAAARRRKKPAFM